MFRVIGGLEGGYLPSYHSQKVESREEAEKILKEKFREEREVTAMTEDREILEEDIEEVVEQGFFTVYRGERAVRRKVKISEVERVIKTSDHQANRMY